MTNKFKMTFLRRFFLHLAAFKKNIFLVIIFHVLTAVFTVVSIPMIIPFFQILFDGSKPATAYGTHEGGISEIEGYINQLLQQYDRQDVLMYVCLAIIAVFFVKNICRYLAMYFMTPVRNGIIKNIRSKIYKQIQSLPLSFLKDSKKGDLLSVVSNDVQEVEWSIVNTLEAFFKSPLIIVGSIIFMISISPKLSLFVLLLLVITIFVIGGISRTLKKNSGLAQSSLGSLLSTVEETIYGQKVIKLYAADKYFEDRFENQNRTYKNLLDKVLRRRDLSSPVSEFLGIVVVTVLLLVGSNQVFEEQLSAAVFFAFIFAFYQVIEPAKSFATAYYNVQKGLGALDRIDSLLLVNGNEETSAIASSLSSFTKGIEFSKVSFKYENDLVLNNINFRVGKGEHLAIVGPSGSGKTSLTDLLLGFITPIKGTITVDDKDIQSISKNQLLSLFSVVNQHPILFYDTIEANIAMSQDIDKDRIITAARLARADIFIDKLPEGYQSKVGSEGMKLSGGERQRICLARAIYRNATIVVLDEATSSIDTESEHHIKEAMKQFLSDKTAIIIAHKLTTIQNVDRIIVLEDGKIVQEGSHEELLGGISGKHYQKIVDLQTV